MKTKETIPTASPQELLSIVARYFGFPSVTKLATPARPDLWRYPAILEEARQIACWALRQHCDLSLEELQVAVKRLRWNGVFIRSAAEQANRKLAEFDVAFLVAVQNIEQMILATVLGMSRKGELK